MPVNRDARDMNPARANTGAGAALALAPGLEPVPGSRLVEPLGRGGYGEVWKGPLLVRARDARWPCGMLSIRSGITIARVANGPCYPTTCSPRVLSDESWR